MNISKICNEFLIEGEFKSFDIITAGNINTTYKVITCDNNVEYQYLVQRINKNVFNKPEKIMENIALANEYLENNPKQKDLIVLNFINTKEGKSYYVDKQGNFWRACNYFDCVCFNSPSDLNVIEEAGKAFGEFQYLFDGYDANKLNITIPDFHDTKKRIYDFELNLKHSINSRKVEASKEVEYILQNKEKAKLLCNLYEEGLLPIRVTHNDTKCNNVLFDKVTKKPIVVIDLDTIMPGMSMYDFADAVRFIANTAVEDEPDTSKVFFDTAKFRAFAKGFIGATHQSLEKVEIENLVKATFSITIELASRFLDDYITGDKYFRCAYPNHNLVRTRCQLQLAKDIERKWDELEWIVRDVIEKI